MYEYAKLMYINILRIGYGRSQFVKFLISVTTTSLRLCSSHLDSYFTANTFWHEYSGLVSLCSELLYITSFELTTVPMSLFDAT
jgi:hypothetical protein